MCASSEDEKISVCVETPAADNTTYQCVRALFNSSVSAMLALAIVVPPVRIGVWRLQPYPRITMATLARRPAPRTPLRGTRSPSCSLTGSGRPDRTYQGGPAIVFGPPSSQFFGAIRRAELIATANSRGRLEAPIPTVGSSGSGGAELETGKDNVSLGRLGGLGVTHLHARLGRPRALLEGACDRLAPPLAEGRQLGLGQGCRFHQPLKEAFVKRAVGARTVHQGQYGVSAPGLCSRAFLVGCLELVDGVATDALGEHRLQGTLCLCVVECNRAGVLVWL